MWVQTRQLRHLALENYVRKLDAAFCRELSGYANVDEGEREDFLNAAMAAARGFGLLTERGIAAYALAAWWLDVGFESQSQLMKALLNTRLPEFRKVHAMNAWVHAYLGETHDVALADDQLRQAFRNTEAWGRGEH
jgi:hypothetical protein